MGPTRQAQEQKQQWSEGDREPGTEEMVREGDGEALAENRRLWQRTGQRKKVQEIRAQK